MSQKFPKGKFKVIYADPPWRFVTRSPKGRGRSPDGPVDRNEQRKNNPARHYETMSLDDIKAMVTEIDKIADKDCVLLMWIVDPLLPEALDVIKAWGFKYKTVGFYWAKLRKAPLKKSRLQDADDERKAFPMGTGYWTRANPEQCLLATRGNPKRISAGVQKLLAMEGQAGIHCIVSPRREHSRKPDEAYDRIEALCGPGPKLELFARNTRPGWASWGNQTDRFDEPKKRSKNDLLGL